MKIIVRKRIVWALSVSVLVLAAVSFALDRASDGPAKHRAQASQDTIAEQWVRLVHRGLEESPSSRRWPFAAIRGEAKDMPQHLKEAAIEVLGEAQPLKLSFGHARYTETPVGVGLWVVQGKGVTCMFRERTATAMCDTTARVERQGLLLEVYRPGASPHDRPTHFLALGIAPDWAKTAHAKVGAKSKTIPVVDNAYGFRAEAPIRIQRLAR